MTKIIIIFLFLVAALAVVIWQGKRYEAFEKTAQKVVATIERKDERKLRRDIPSNTENWLVYSYEVAGQAYTGEDKVEFDDLWLDYKAGGKIEIYYNSNNPKESHPAAVFDRRIAMTKKLSN